MFNGILKSDDVEVYENISGYGDTLFLSDTCKSNIIIFGVGSTYLNLPNNSYIGKVINITCIYGVSPTGKGASSSFLSIQHSKTTLFTLRQGTVSFMYVGQQLNGLTTTDKAKSGWIILGGVQGDTAITGYAGSVVQGAGAYVSGVNGATYGLNSVATTNSASFGANSVSSANATALGTTANAQAQYSIAEGYQCYAQSMKLSIKANNNFSITADAQAGKFILLRETTSATPLVLSADRSNASTSNILILPNNGTYAFKGMVVAKDATTLDSAMWEVTALMKRGGNASTTTLIGSTITKVFNDAGASAWTIALTADTTNGGGAITVTGEAGKTIRWVANIDSAEVI